MGTEPTKLKGYWIGHVDPVKQDPYMAYAMAAKEAVKKYGGRYMVRAGESTQAEGKWRARAVMIEFADYQTALDCYNSPEYQAAKKIRIDADASIAELLIIEGSAEAVE